jgi:hypothetical protein
VISNECVGARHVPCAELFVVCSGCSLRLCSVGLEQLLAGRLQVRSAFRARKLHSKVKTEESGTATWDLFDHSQRF